MGISSIESVGQIGLPGFIPMGVGNNAQNAWPGMQPQSDTSAPETQKAPSNPAAENNSANKTSSSEKSAPKGVKNGDELTKDQQQEVDKLKARDVDVRAHEQAHAAVGGRYAGAPSYTYQTGPDGKRYAVGGEVSIDASEVKDDPKATVRKMEIVQAAAMAPADPSGQDLAVAAEAAQKEAEATAEMAQQPTTGGSGNDASQSQDAARKTASGTSQKTDFSASATNAPTLRYTVNSQNNAPVLIAKQTRSASFNVLA